MKKWLSGCVFLLAVMVLLVALSGCGNSANKAAGESSLAGDVQDTGSGGATVATSSLINRKVITTVTLSAQTKTYDRFMKDLQQEIKENGGYQETMDYHTDSYDGLKNRSCDMVARIPSDKTETFVAFVESNSRVTDKTIGSEDVTTSYIDTQSRLSALKTEKAALEALLAKAGSVEEIMSVREKLTDVIAEIEAMESQIRSFDSQINYTAVTINIMETDVLMSSDSSVFGQIGTNFMRNLEHIGNFFVGLFIAVGSGLPFLVLIGVITLVIILIVRHQQKKSLKKRQEAIAAMNAATATAPQNP